jgi:hypothetical protein
MSEEEAVALIAHTSPAVGAPLFPSLLSTGPGPLRLSDLKDSNPKSLNQTAPAALVAFPSLFTRSNLFDETFPSLSLLEEPAKEATHDLLLVRLSRCVTEAIAIIEETFDQTDSFVESISLAPLLELLSDCYDRSVLSPHSIALSDPPLWIDKATTRALFTIACMLQLLKKGPLVRIRPRRSPASSNAYD